MIKKIGVIRVDAGICWLGDPCYILHKSKNDFPKELGKNWRDFCDKLGEEYPTAKQFNYNLGHPGLGVCVSTGYGDGCYDVMAEIVDNRIKKVWIEFF